MYLSEDEVARFYRAAVIGLRAIEAGPLRDVLVPPRNKKASARARIEALLRSAAAVWPDAFSPRAVFDAPLEARDDASEDDGEPDPIFPEGWPGLATRDATKLWKATPPLSGAPALRAVAKALGVRPYEMRGQYIGLSRTTSVLVGGVYATWQTAEEFFARDGLSWTEQVTVIATRAIERQLAGLIAPLAGARAPTQLIAPSEAPARPPPQLRLWSQDASDEIARHIRPPKPGSSLSVHRP